ncbi:hypothetical protein EE612_060177 [Oryza sativa]|nr:hypothetical protein EE612_060177 [Oryza sativa]
MRELYTEER